MCGIAGIIQPDPSLSPANALDAMRQALAHRGPDDAGSFISADQRAGLTHTRLAILDLSSAGHQPMTAANGRHFITFNGEIYNFRELRKELESVGETFRTQTDTETILKLYERHGPECVTRLRGMFAFAIWDQLDRACFLARDSLGIKPLYYHLEQGRLSFASELRALLASGLVPRRLNPAGIFGYFCSGTVPEPETILLDVKCLEAGHWLLWKAGRIEKRNYWGWHFGNGAGAPDSPKVVRDALLDSVRHHFVSDVPVGVFLSGGIDSTAIVALSRAVGQQELKTFCISFAEREFDEAAQARDTAKRFGTDHSELRLDAVAGRELFQGFLERLDQPSIDGFNSFCVSKFAHDKGMKVVLSGLGGDEMFGGYPSFRQVPRLVRLSRQMESFAGVRRSAGALLEHCAPNSPFRRVGAFLQCDPDMVSAYEAFRGIFTHSDSQRLTQRYCHSLHNPLPHPPTEFPADEGDQVCDLELRRYLRNQLLRDTDAMSMAWGLELRVPFVDQRLIESLFRIPAALRLAPGKRLLLDAVPEIPEAVANAPKRGFRFPFDRWMSAEWGELFKGLGRSRSVRAGTWYQKWSLFVLEHWCKRHGVT